MEKMVSATGFSPSLGKLDNLPYVHVICAYDHHDGTTLIIEYNNTIYLGKEMEDSLCNSIQSEEAGTKVDIRPRHYYEKSDGSQTMTFPDGTVVPINYDGVFPYISVRQPRPLEIDNCRRIQLTLKDDWDPCHYQNRLSVLTGKPVSKISITYTDPISSKLMSCKLKERSRSHQLLYNIRQGERTTNNLSLRALGTFR